MSIFSSKGAFLCLLCLVALALVPQAQAAGDIKPGAAPKLDPADFPLSEVEQWTSPRVDVDFLLDEDEGNRANFDIPYRIGFPMKTASILASPPLIAACAAS